ncbi:MAG: DUF1614 domain-containing protein [bacterium]|jgi:uncharacterized membrane protein
MHYIPLAAPFFLVLFLFFISLVVLVELRILQYTYEKVGVEQRYMFFLLLFSFLGSYINIPVAHLPPEQLVTPRIVEFFGMEYMVPAVIERPGTVIAVNFGGAVIPVILSIYLIAKNKLYTESILAVAIVTFVVHIMAYPVPGIGIAEPMFIPPLVTAVAALVISRPHAAPLAYIAGSLGTLIGADLLNLRLIHGLGAPVASIGGAGKFDGIFLTGLIAVLLAGLVSRKPRPSPTAAG